MVHVSVLSSGPPGTSYAYLRTRLPFAPFSTLVVPGPVTLHPAVPPPSLATARPQTQTLASRAQAVRLTIRRMRLLLRKLEAPVSLALGAVHIGRRLGRARGLFRAHFRRDETSR